MVKKESIKKVAAKSYVFLVLLIMYLPILVLAVYSFTVSDQLGTWNGFSFQLYKDLVQNKPLMQAVKNTVTIALVSAFCSTILGTIGAIGVYYAKKNYKKTVKTQCPTSKVAKEYLASKALNKTAKDNAITISALTTGS